jgi:hypothetical protein
MHHKSNCANFPSPQALIFARGQAIVNGVLLQSSAFTQYFCSPAHHHAI